MLLFYSMYKILLVGSGGFIGSVLRYLVSSGVHRLFKGPILPYGTLAVNVSGCLLIGFLGGVAENKQLLTADVRLFLFLGIILFIRLGRLDLLRQLFLLLFLLLLRRTLENQTTI